LKLEFWFEFASTYSYIASARVSDVCAAAGVELEWQPFLLGPIFQAQGLSDSPFNLYPAKGRYMWRDLERVCESQALAFTRPSEFPRNGLTAARIACAARDEAWLPQFVRAVYAANFGQDRDIADREVLKDILFAVEADPEVWIVRADEAASKKRLRDQTERAQARGIFGAPSFTVGDELFWGNERLGDAVVWASTR
jgi:2-hydroxychromene-2-carboxylate isomerase